MSDKAPAEAPPTDAPSTNDTRTMTAANDALTAEPSTPTSTDDPVGQVFLDTRQDQTLHHIVIVGGGAAGLELATSLGDRLGKRKQAVITLIERSRTHM